MNTLYIQFNNERTWALLTRIMYGIVLVALKLSLSMFWVISDKRMWNRTERLYGTEQNSDCMEKKKNSSFCGCAFTRSRKQAAP